MLTDYPDAELVENMKLNVKDCALMTDKSLIAVEGYLWGAPVERLTAHLNEPEKSFDLLILADLLFNHSEHRALLATLSKTLSRRRCARALVFFTPYRPWLLQKDLAFFDLARDAGFVVKKIFEKVLENVMFENDRGDEVLRRTVFGYELLWKKNLTEHMYESVPCLSTSEDKI